jgi:hypothetical protein
MHSAQSVPGHTEEDVKNNIVIPWLRRSGIEPAETSFEDGFSIRLGLSQTVPGKKHQGKIAGRFDTLVKRNGRNLLIVEFKASGVVLNEDDRDQAISYARLLEQVAPYALVTNGFEFRLYDVLTKERCDGKPICDSYVISLPDDLLGRFKDQFEGWFDIRSSWKH